MAGVVVVEVTEEDSAVALLKEMVSNCIHFGYSCWYWDRMRRETAGCYLTR